MVKKYVFGTPFPTGAVTAPIPPEAGAPEIGAVSAGEGFEFRYQMAPEEVVFGLGEANRGINKRGYLYVSSCADDPNHTEEKVSLYGAHNFIVVFGGARAFALFVDYPGVTAFDICYTKYDELKITCGRADLELYVLTGGAAYELVREFRGIIGRSYIPPKFAFGYGQSRWGYKCASDIRRVVEGHRENRVPLDMVYLDIDYMQDYKDFTVNEERFPDFPAFVREMREQHIHLVPIIDAGVKVEKGYPVYDEGVEKGYFCTREDGSVFEGAVWPGWSHFPDMLDREARAWFGDQYKFLLDQGIDAFWNDMNEPAVFYSREQEAEARAAMLGYLDGDVELFGVGTLLASQANSQKVRESFYHNVGGERVRHDRVHNLYGYGMTRAAGEAFERLAPDRRILLFSRSSYIGMHRYGGIWTGDNKSWWSHLLLNLKMMPSLNMCGFLYCGADLGGFGADTSRDLLLRWLALGVFTPLMRNHSALGTREQEVYQFERVEDFAAVIRVRYRLLPYIYSEFMKAALGDDLYFKPLCFVWPEDRRAVEVEDQLVIGNEVMIAPVYTQNASGRYVYLPEEMMFVKFRADGSIFTEVLPAGHHYVDVALTEVPLFIRKGRAIPVAEPCMNVEELDPSTIRMLGWEGAPYERYDDDGVSRI